MILIGLGANLPTKKFGLPRAALGAALQAIENSGIRIKQRASWYKTAPVPISDQPWYINGVAELETHLSPTAIICALLELEKDFGRVRTVPNAPRILDLDLLAYNDQIITGTTPADITVPHPRAHERSFVILPLREIAPNWCDPVTGKTIDDIANHLPKEQQARKMTDAKGVFGSEWTLT
jgi:2-amino-4-hydroxy-6-hydroxymethyldihydropteridine diphosphokinase